MYSVIIISSFLQWNSITSTHSSHQFQALWQCLFSDFWEKKWTSVERSFLQLSRVE